MYLGSFLIDDLCTFTVNSHTPTTGAAVAADAVPGYRIYEDETATPILTGTMATLDAGNATGFYSEQITLSAANGFEYGKSYTIRITIVVGGVTGTSIQRLQMGAKVDARLIAGQAITAAAGVTFPASIASPTNITAGVITTVTNLTNAPTAGDLTAAMKGSVQTSATAALVAFFVSAAQLVTDIWSAATRLLTAGTNIVLAKGVGVTGFNDLSAAQVNAEADTALVDYDGPTHAEMTVELATSDDAVLAQVALVKARTDNLPDDPADQSLIIAATNSITSAIAALNNLASGSAMTLTAGERTAIATALLDLANGIEAGLTLREAHRLEVAALAGKLSGATGPTVTIRNAVADSKDRITATVDINGNRTAVVTDVS